MSKIIITTVSFLFSLMAFGQVSETRTVAEFSKLKASQGIEVFYTVSATQSLKVETDDNEKLAYIKTEVEGQTLKVYVDNNSKEDYSYGTGKGKNINGMRFKVLKVYITGKALTAIKASSSASVKVENLNSVDQLEVAASSSATVSGIFDCTDLQVDVSSSGNFKGKVNAQNVAVEVSSSADCDLIGKAVKVTIKASSSADCNAKDLVAEVVTVKASSSADVTVFATKSLDATATSSSSVDYFGNPFQVNTDKSSSGSVNKR
ncbi:head GIN domain-containing protein [Flavobacterium sp. TBRC 19031]|uniref:head GIN domain-containing protein n=1 Tax=Flavobacterium mekongense TaxID=3379707 RepID=UPI00399B8B7A